MDNARYCADTSCFSGYRRLGMLPVPSPHRSEKSNPHAPADNETATPAQRYLRWPRRSVAIQKSRLLTLYPGRVCFVLGIIHAYVILSYAIFDAALIDELQYPLLSLSVRPRKESVRT